MKHQKFWTQKLFEKQNEVQMSIQEIADFFGISHSSARNYIKRDLEAKLVERWKQFVESKKKRLVCQGKNIYKLKGS